LSSKLFRIKGEINKAHFFEPMTFNKLVTAVKQEHAMEQVYTELGSKHRAKRFQIKVHSIEQVESEE
jgi:large subunit ribosomal protein LX